MKIVKQLNLKAFVTGILVVFLLQACGSKKKLPKGQLVLKDSIMVNAGGDELKLLDKSRAGNVYVEDSLEKYILVTNNNAFVSNRIILQKNKSRISQLYDLDTLLEKYKINGYYFISPDSIIGMSWSIPRVLYLFDINGQIKKTWPFQLDSQTGIPAMFYGGEYYAPILFDKGKKEFFAIANTPYMPYVTPAQYYSYNHIACIGLDKDSAYVKCHFGNWPQMYQDKNYGMSGSDYCAALFGGLCWMSFCKSDSLYGYKDGKLVSVIRMSSPYVHQSNKYFDTAQEGNYDYINRYCYEQSAYGYMLTDRMGNYLYRTADHENGNYYNADSTTNVFINKPWSVIVADKNMNVIIEKTFNGGSLNMTRIYATPKGIWIKGLAEPNKYYYYEVAL